MSNIALTAIGISTTELQIDWGYSSFDSETEIEISTDGISFSPVSGSPFASGVATTIESGLVGATKYYVRIKKSEWNCYSETIEKSTLASQLVFDGVNDFVKSTNGSGVSEILPFEAIIRVQLPSTLTNGHLFCINNFTEAQLGYNGNPHVSSFFDNASRVTSQVYRQAGGSDYMRKISTAPISLVNEVEIKTTYDGSNTLAGLKIFYDGVEQGVTTTGTSNIPNLVDIDTAPVWLMTYYGSRFSSGNLRYFSLEVDGVLNREFLVDEGAGTTLNDNSGNGNHGTIDGAVWDTYAID
jgi:hypothetical protein